MIEKIEKEILYKMLDDNINGYLIAFPVKPDIKIDTIHNTWYTNLNVAVEASEWRGLCNCPKCRGKVWKNNSPSCPECTVGHANKKMIYLLSPKDKKMVENMINEEVERLSLNRQRTNIYVYFTDYIRVSYYKARERLFRTYYVREKMDGSDGIDIVRVTLNAVIDDNYNASIEEKYDSFTEIIPGKQIVAKKKTKAKGEEEISLFDAFHITSDNVTEDENVCFDGADSMIEFMSANEAFSRKTGFLNLLMNYSGEIPENSLFLLYMYLLSEYPVIELLVKMGYYGLVFGLFKKIQSCYKRDSIKENVNELSNLLNQTTKGKAALSIPSYIGSYLNAKNASIDEYMTWASINEREPISEKTFNEYIRSEAYLYLNYYNELKNLPNIMKYGYTLAKASKYIMQQYHHDSYGKMNVRNKPPYGVSHFNTIAFLWKDYLEMCEVLGFEAAKFPKNLKSVHDDVMSARESLRNIETDVKLGLIAEAYEGYSSDSKYLTVVFPKCTSDFIREGNEQHNCVGGYSRYVHEGRCRIFFIRRKDQPDSSYITAECTKSGLRQLFYRNNQAVTDYREREFAKAVCKFILSRPWEPDEKKIKDKLKEAQMKNQAMNM